MSGVFSAGATPQALALLHGQASGAQHELDFEHAAIDKPLTQSARHKTNPPQRGDLIDVRGVFISAKERIRHARARGSATFGNIQLFVARQKPDYRRLIR